MYRRSKTVATDRKSILVPAEWHALIAKLAGERQKPIMWLLVDLVQREAKAHGETCPPAPWEGNGK